MVEASRMGGRFAASLSACFSVCLLIFVSKEAECWFDPPPEENLDHLFEGLHGATPASSSWVGIARLPAHASFQQPFSPAWLLEDEMGMGEADTEADLIKPEVSFFAFDLRGRAVGYLVGHVKDGRGHLDFLNVSALGSTKAVGEAVALSSKH